MPLKLETHRLILRPLQDADLHSLTGYRSDPLVYKYQGWKVPYTEGDAARFIDRMKNTHPATPGAWYQLALELKAGGTMIGDCAFCLMAEDSNQAKIGFTLARAYQGQGYGAEAVTRLLGYLFEELGLHRVWAICDVENLASARLLERMGMRREAHYLENVWLGDRWGSEYEYGLLRREWISNATGDGSVQLD